MDSDKWSVAGLRPTDHDREMFDCRAIAAKGNHLAVGRAAAQRHMSRKQFDADQPLSLSI